MEQLYKKLDALRTKWQKAANIIELPELIKQQKQLETDMSRPDFWQDSEAAQATTKQAVGIKQRIEPWQDLGNSLEELGELILLNDPETEEELNAQLTKLENKYEQLAKELLFSGPYDSREVILSIYAGAGGTDAQDWASMLLRMYVRWAEQNGINVTTISESSGEEAGIKSVTLRLGGSPFLYGKLKGEHGVHRLVRLSPFNADNLRQTSFAKVEVLPTLDKPEDVVLDEKDLKIDVFRAGGHGGQSVNTTDSAVRVTHLPTGVTVSIQNERSQLQNKETALTILRAKLVQLQLEQHKETLQDIKGPNQSAEWGNQIRSYVLHPYTMVKDLRTKHETSDVQKVLDGDFNQFIDAFATNL